MPKLDDNLILIVSNHLAGDPQDEDLVWTYLSAAEIADRLAELDTPVCPNTVRAMLEDIGLSQRKIEKTKTMGEAKFRNEQFENIADLMLEYWSSFNPILSMDTKKKELLGEFFRPGTAYGASSDRAWDHDFRSRALGVVIPHGVFDLKLNLGYLTLGASHDTSEFACDNLFWWWRSYGQYEWPTADSILLLCDCGGSNNCHHHIFKEDLQKTVNRIGIPIRVAHYPPYCSKYNPIEHRLFPHVHRAWSGVMFRNINIVVERLKHARTRTGLKVIGRIIDKVYQLKRKASAKFLEVNPIRFADFLPQWNYTVVPTHY